MSKSRELGGIAGRISAGGEGGSASLASCTASGFLFAPSPLSAGALAGRVSGATADACEASVSLNPTLLPAFGGSEDLLTSASFGTAVSRTSLYAVMLREEYAGVWETSAAEAAGAENAPALVQALREQLQAAGAALAPFDTFTLSGNTLGWTAKDGSSQSCSFENLGSCRVRNAGESFREYDICRTDSDDPALACFFAEHTTDDGPLSLCFGSDEGALFRLASQGALPPAVWIEPDTSGKAVEDAIRALVRSAAP